MPSLELSLSTGVVALLDTEDRAGDKSECSDAGDTDDDEPSAFGATSFSTVWDITTADAGAGGDNGGVGGGGSCWRGVVGSS